MSDGTEKTHLAATHLELGLTSGVLLNLNDYAIRGQSRTLLREASFLLETMTNSRTSLISLGYDRVNTPFNTVRLISFITRQEKVTSTIP